MSIFKEIPQFISLLFQVRKFESLIRASLEQKYASSPAKIRDTFLGSHPLLQWRLFDFIGRYLRHRTYPVFRLPRLLHFLMDIKLQMYYLQEVDLGGYNRLYSQGLDSKKPLRTPHLALARMSIDQTVIVKSRILWERIMNFIYFMETGDILEDKISKSKSKVKEFFEFVDNKPKWRFLSPFKDEITRHDQAFRTPEVHKSSFLRAQMLRGEVSDINAQLNLLNRAINSIWENIQSIIAGGSAIIFSDLHLIDDHEIDPKYLGANVKD